MMEMFEQVGTLTKVLSRRAAQGSEAQSAFHRGKSPNPRNQSASRKLPAQHTLFSSVHFRSDYHFTHG
jgi:hypothetical protein